MHNARVLRTLSNAIALLALACAGVACSPGGSSGDLDGQPGGTSAPPLLVGDGEMPTPETVGLRDGTELRELTPSDVRHGGTYQAVRLVGDLELGAGERVRFEDCLIEGSIVTYAPLEMERCDLIGGLYPYDVGGWLRDVLIDSPQGQAFRPALSELQGWDRSTPWLLEHVYLRVPPGGEGDHVEAAQVLGGRDLVFRDVVFDTGCPFNNTQTADLNLHAADSLIEDSWFVGCGGYAIYSDGPNVRIVRPRIGERHQWGLLYTDQATGRIDPQIVDPRDLSGRVLAE